MYHTPDPRITTVNLDGSAIFEIIRIGTRVYLVLRWREGHQPQNPKKKSAANKWMRLTCIRMIETTGGLVREMKEKGGPNHN